MAMNVATYVVCGFHQGHRLKPQHFKTEEQAREHAAYMNQSADFVILTTCNAQIGQVHGAPLRGRRPLRAV
jgi:hypothetical protein